MNPFLCSALFLFTSTALGAPAGPLALTENVKIAQRTTATTTRAQTAGSQKAGATHSESQALVAAPASGLSINSPQFKRLFGPGVYIMDALADLNVGVIKGHTYIASHRFRATFSGKPLALRVYWPAGPGYSAGNGGTISVRIVPDDGSNENLPALNVSPLATGTYAPGLILGRHVLSSFNDEVRLGSLAPLVAGQLYHVVYENIDPEPAKNFIGVNNVVTVERNGRPARWLDPTDWASLFGFRSAGTKGLTFGRMRPGLRTPAFTTLRSCRSISTAAGPLAQSILKPATSREVGNGRSIQDNRFGNASHRKRPGRYRVCRYMRQQLPEAKSNGHFEMQTRCWRPEG